MHRVKSDLPHPVGMPATELLHGLGRPIDRCCNLPSVPNPELAVVPCSDKLNMGGNRGIPSKALTI